LETWRTIPDTDGLYEASNEGRIRSWRSPGRWGRMLTEPMILEPKAIPPYGHLRVNAAGIGPNGRRYEQVHRLVLLAFVGPCPPGMEGCHNDGDPSNNRLENLRWDTAKSNGRDKVLHGTVPRGESSNLAELTEGDVREIRRLAAELVPLRLIAAQFDVDDKTVGAIAHGRTWTHVDGPRLAGDALRRGVLAPTAKLTPDIVREARRLHAEGATFTELAERFGVSRPGLTNAIRGKSWAHVTD